jgi:hypothetical protein
MSVKIYKIVLCTACLMMFYSGICFAEQAKLKNGGPDYLYFTPKKKSPRHHVYDEELKCIDCHKHNGVDAYTSATMGLKKTQKGSMPRDEIKKAVMEALNGAGNLREIFVLSTSFDDQSLGTVIEFALDPATFNFISLSEIQTEKLFHIAANEKVCLTYVKQRDDHEYFKDPLGVQIVGKARLFKGDDPEFEELMKVYLPTMPSPQTEAGKKAMLNMDRMMQWAKASMISTRIIPERIVVFNGKFKEKGYNMKQIWEATNE